MADGITVEINSVAFEAALQRLRKGVSDGLIEPKFGLLTTQARLLSQRCQDFTPPIAKGKDDNARYLAGTYAVKRDLTRIFRPISADTWHKSVARIVSTDNRPAWNKFASNINGPLRNTRAIGFSSAWHDANRISRGRARGLLGKAKMAANGAIRKAKDNLGVVTLGPEAEKARAYTATIQRRVGWARAGWNAGIVAFGGGGGKFGDGKKIAPWVSWHGIGHGNAIDGTASAEPFVKITNSTSWASYDGARIVRNAIAARARDIQIYAERIMRIAAKKAQSEMVSTSSV